MSDTPTKHHENVVSMRPGVPGNGYAGRDVDDHAVGTLSLAVPGSSQDPLMGEALRLMEAFLAIEDTAARAALIALAERLVSYDWVRRAQPR